MRGGPRPLASRRQRKRLAKRGMENRRYELIEIDRFLVEKTHAIVR